MDIKLPLINLLSPSPTLPGLGSANLLDLKVGQALDVKVINALVTTAQNTIALKLGNQLVNVQSSQPLNLRPGQELSIQVTQVTPTLEFKILSPLPEVTSQPVLLSQPPQVAQVKQQLQAKVVEVNDRHIQLQIAPESSNPGQQKTTTITVDRASIPPTTQVVIGQQVALEIIPSEKKTQYRLIANVEDKIETKLATLVKQLLPRQESPNQLITQLHKELPRLLLNPAVPQSLKQIISETLNSLPQREQLFDGEHLAKVISNSGIFLEAKLPLLINTAVAGGLKEAIVNLLQKLPQQTATPKDAIELSSQEILIKDDLKASLGKLLIVLKQEISKQDDLGVSNTELDALKNLHQKVENSVAKIVLEQLASLPKEDASKQLWQCEIVFIDKAQTQTAQLEIQLDKANDPSIKPDNWSVNITITPPGLGAIHCVVSCRDKVISTFFKTQQKESASLINDNLEYLKTQLEDQGLIVGQMTAHEGGRQKSIKPAGSTHRKKLFDDHA